MVFSRQHFWRIAGVSVTGVVLAWMALVWIVPRMAFGRGRVSQALGDAVSGKASFRSFRNLYFPHPGCIAEGVTVRRGDDRNQPLIAASKLTIVGSYWSVLSKKIPLVKADGVVVRTDGGGWPENGSKSNIVIERFVADDARLVIPGKAGKQALEFPVHHLRMENWGENARTSFRAQLSNPMPPGEIAVNGEVGPWKKSERQSIPLEGSYSLRHADLSAVGGIGGLLSSDGSFRGVVEKLKVEGVTDTPEFEMTSNHHKFPVHSRFLAEVNATNGDVQLKQVEVKVRATDLAIQGSIAAEAPRQPHTAKLEIVARDARIQDLLFPFVEANRSPLTGTTSWRARVTVGAGDAPFLRRVTLNATFGVEDAHFTNRKTQTELDNASERARGDTKDDPPEDVVSDLSGHVVLRQGTASFSNFKFEVPGAVAQMQGTYNVTNQRVNLHGIVRLQAKISDATSGVKSFLLKALSPFLKKQKPREPLPIAVTGTFAHPRYSISVQKNKNAQGK